MVELRIGTETFRLSYEEFEERVRAGRVPTNALVRFEPITGSSWAQAGSLEWVQDLQNNRPKGWGRLLLSGPAPLMTALLTGIQIRLWWLAHLPEVEGWAADHLIQAGPPILEDGEVWRLFTMGLVHFEWKHLALNMLFFIYTAWSLERLYGKTHLVVIFLGSVFSGSLLSMWGSPAAASLGASGGIFGLMGACVMVGLVRPHLVPPRAQMRFGLALAPYLALVLWSGLQDPSIDNWSHMGGLVTGALLVLFLDPPSHQRSPHWNRKAHATLGLMAVTSMLLITRCGPHVTPLAPHLEVRLAASGKPAPPEADGHQEWGWSAPLGWQPGLNLLGEPAFVSPSKPRSWAVFLEREETVQTPEALHQTWRDAWSKAWPNALVSSPEPSFCAPDVAGLTSMARVETPTGERWVTWCGATRGVTSLSWTWEVAAVDEVRMAPLFARLWSEVFWNEPASLHNARREASAHPSQVRAQSQLALALARYGACEQAVSILTPLLQASPEEEDLWQSLFESHSLDPAGCPDPRPWWGEGFTATSAPHVWAALADSMASAGAAEAATGTRLLTRFRAPKNRRIRRALEREGWPLGLDPQTEHPWALHFRLDTLAARPDDQVQHWEGAPASVELALAVYGTLTEERRRLIERIRTGEVDPRDGLTILRNGQPPDHSASEVRLLRSDLERAAENNAPSWFPDALSPLISDTLKMLPPPETP